MLNMEALLLDNSQVIGHLYVILNTATNKQYVGQTLSHRKNHNKYRPFGYQGRFKDHVSEAVCNTKKKQCMYLNNAIRSYGADVFRVELITTCPKDDLDRLEEQYIKEYDTLYPNGYNLTIGGKVFKGMVATIDPSHPISAPKARGGSTSRSAETRAKMSERLKIARSTPDAVESQILRSQAQHSRAKLAIFKDVTIDMEHIDSYIKVRKTKNGTLVKVMIGGKTTSFAGKYESLENTKERALQFIRSIQSSATLPNCSGTP